jgi:hypothetical protein
MPFNKNYAKEMKFNAIMKNSLMFKYLKPKPKKESPRKKGRKLDMEIGDTIPVHPYIPSVEN